MRTLIMMFVFLVAQTSFCLAKTVYPSEESKKILSKGKLVGEWDADGRKAGVFDDAQIPPTQHQSHKQSSLFSHPSSSIAMLLLFILI